MANGREHPALSQPTAPPSPAWALPVCESGLAEQAAVWGLWLDSRAGQRGAVIWCARTSALSADRVPGT